MWTLALEATEPTAVLDLVAVVVQALAVLVAVGASIVALSISGRDRRTQLRIAERDREVARLQTELSYAVQLLANRARGGSSDREERARLGAEALALAAVVGQRWVPRQFLRATDGATAVEMREMLDGSDTQEMPEWVKDKIEASLAIQSILDGLYRKE